MKMKDLKNYRFYWEKPAGKNELNVKIEVPGFSRNEISVNLTSNAISISANKKDKTVQKGKGFFRKETHENSFSKLISLPFKINVKDFNVEVDDGTVTIKRRRKRSSKN